MLKGDKESKLLTTDKVNTANTANTAFYLVEIGNFKLSGTDITNLSSLSLILYLIFSFTLKSILNSNLILALAIIFGNLVYWFFLSFLQIKTTPKLDNNSNNNNSNN